MRCILTSEPESKTGHEVQSIAFFPCLITLEFTRNRFFGREKLAEGSSPLPNRNEATQNRNSRHKKPGSPNTTTETRTTHLMHLGESEDCWSNFMRTMAQRGFSTSINGI